MVKRKRSGGVIDIATGLTRVSVAASVGGQVAVTAGGSAAGLSTFSSFTPAFGAIGGAAVATRQLGALKPKKSKGRR